MFYVYGYLDDRDEIYYVGKGKGRRYNHPHHHLVNVPFDDDKIIFFEKNMTEE